MKVITQTSKKRPRREVLHQEQLRGTMGHLQIGVRLMRACYLAGGLASSAKYQPTLEQLTVDVDTLDSELEHWRASLGELRADIAELKEKTATATAAV